MPAWCARNSCEGPGTSRVTIFRARSGREDSFAAKEDTELLPGYVVEVSVRSEGLPMAGENLQPTSEQREQWQRD
jgi:hypothetical protein